jgi:hypothetical protein
LARARGIDVELLWRQLWKIPAGGISRAFIEVLKGVLLEHGRTPLGALERQRVIILARRQFGSRTGTEMPDPEALVAAWRQAIR